MSIAERLGIFINHLGISTQEFEIQCKISGGTASRITSKSYPKTFGRIATAYPQLNIDWLKTGKGAMLNSTDITDTTKNPKDTYDKDSISKERLIPFYDVETTGGYNGLVSSSEEGTLTGYIQPGGWFDGYETAAIRHVGDSMTEYPNGCVLAVREVKEKRLLVPGRNYVIETREYRVTKRVQHGSRENTLMLYSSNTDKYEDGRLVHEPFEVNIEDVLHIYSVLGYIVNQSGEFRLIKP